MLIDRIAHRYAKSLYDLAVERKEADAVYDEVLALEKLYEESRDLRVLLRSPVITAVRKAPIIEAMFKGKISDLMLKFIVNLTRRSREPILPQVLAEFRRQYRQAHNLTEARLVTAQPMSEPLKQELKVKLEQQLKTTVIFEEVIDPRVIGGFEVQIGTSLYDATIQNALRLVRREFATA